MENITYIKLWIIEITTFNRQRFHFSAKDVHDSNALGENKGEKNETMKHKSKHRVFLFIVKRKIKDLNNLIKTIFNLRRGNTRRECIGTCKYSVLKIRNGGSPREHVKTRRGAARADRGIKL